MSEMILRALRWYLACSTSYHDLTSMLSDRGVVVDPTTLFRWVQAHMAMIRNGKTHDIDGRDVPAQAAFIAELFAVAA